MSTPKFIGNFVLAFIITGILMETSASGAFGSTLQSGARKIQRGFDGSS